MMAVMKTVDKKKHSQILIEREILPVGFFDKTCFSLIPQSFVLAFPKRLVQKASQASGRAKTSALVSSSAASSLWANANVSGWA